MPVPIYWNNFFEKFLKLQVYFEPHRKFTERQEINPGAWRKAGTNEKRRELYSALYGEQLTGKI